MHMPTMVVKPISKPYAVKCGIKVTIDTNTKKFENVPESMKEVFGEDAGTIIDDSHLDPNLIPALPKSHKKRQSISPKVHDVLKTLSKAPATRSYDGLPPVEKFLRFDNPNSYLLDKVKIAEGSTCHIYLADFHGRKVAMKEMVLSPRKEAILLNEIRLMATMKHPNIIDFISAHRVGNMLWIIMEYLEGGCLTPVATLCDLQENHIAYFAREILKGISYMHSQNRIHRDIKTDNVLVTNDGHVKLADFGYSAQLTFTSAHRKSMVGTPFWMAPELIKGQEYSFPVDIWSLGILCRELAEGQPPYSQLPPMKALIQIGRHGVPKIANEENWSPEFLSFLDLCLAFDPEKRATAGDLLHHPFLAKACNVSYIPPLIELAQTLSSDSPTNSMTSLSISM